MMKKFKMEKHERTLNLRSVDEELKRIKNKILLTPFMPKVNIVKNYYNRWTFILF